MCQEQFKNLLSGIDTQLLVSEKTSQERGDNFNIFRIIKMGSNETSVHSAFLAELLNPSGRHGAGDVFLKLFINCIFPDFAFNTEMSSVKLEEDIGEITKTSGGRIDLILKDNTGKAIIIENKIYAEDQDKQMLRYYNYAKDNFPDAFKLIYLSLNGDVHDMAKTTGGKDIPFFTISYRDDIIPWLDCCLKEVAEKPLIREGIIHYRNLLKYLTHTDMKAETRTALIEEVLKEKEHIQNINNYMMILESAEKKLLELFWDKLFKQMREEKDADGSSTFENLSVFERKNMLYKSYENNAGAIFGKSFKFNGGRRKYDYQFGIQTLVKELDNDCQLMLGIIVDKKISIRLYIISKNTSLLSIDNWGKLYEGIYQFSSNCGFQKKTGRNDFWLKYLSDNENDWNFGELNNETLGLLSNMDEQIGSIITIFKRNITAAHEQLKAPIVCHT